MKKQIVGYYNARYSAQTQQSSWFRFEGIMRRWAELGGIRRGVRARVADIACGTGEFLAFISREFPGLELFGLDISGEAIRIARKKVPTARLVVGSGERLPWKSEFFDVLFSIGSLEHYSDIEGGICELARVLKPDGKAVIIVPNAYWLNYVLHAWLSGARPTQNQPQEFFTSLNGWRELLEANGLAVLEVKKQNIPFDPRLLSLHSPAAFVKNFYNLLVDVLPVTFCSHFIFMCGKRRS